MLRVPPRLELQMLSFLTFSAPNTRPDNDPSALWALQNVILQHAQSLLGPRNPSKILYHPVFDADGPIVCNTPNLDGGFAKLGIRSIDSWPVALEQLSHETVHLLHPIPGMASWLEEAVAVEFSNHCCDLANAPRAHLSGNYFVALAEARRLNVDLFDLTKRLRKNGEVQLSSISASDLALAVQSLGGECDLELAEFLTSKFHGR